ncbi:MAG: c-type cytochrome [Gammaproteobacteria bacterium]
MKKVFVPFLPLFLALLAASFLAFASAEAGDIAAGEIKAEPCAACHGAGGNEPIGANPKIAGQSRKYLLQVMREYRNGKRTDPIMNAQIGENTGITDEDLQDLAAYFAGQPGDLR